jgi:hypothetical protein
MKHLENLLLDCKHRSLFAEEKKMSKLDHVSRVDVAFIEFLISLAGAYKKYFQSFSKKNTMFE